MFSRLRFRLTLLYLLAAIVLTGLIDGGVYTLLRYSFQTATDQALQRKVALGSRSLTVVTSPQPTLALEGEGENAEEGGGAAPVGQAGAGSSAMLGGEGEDVYDAELAPVFLVPLDSEGRVVPGSTAGAAPLSPDAEAVRAATAEGNDLRTLVQPDGTRYRLLTTRVVTSSGTLYLQAGRSLADQEGILRQLLVGMLALSAVIVLLLGWGSWWLAGRSLGPAQQAWEKQQAFVANASHELRTPLTLLRASAEVAQRKLPSTGESRVLLDDVLREADHMAGVVEDLLLLSRLDAGALPVQTEAVPVSGLFEGVATSAGRVAKERGVLLEFGASGATAVGDAARLRQVLLVLVDNALRHTPPGGKIRVDARQDARALEITVRDSGSGIAPEHLPHVFERFYRADPDRSGGSGLGLPIARSLLKAMAGDIRLESGPGQGTCVTVTLPAAHELRRGGPGG